MNKKIFLTLLLFLLLFLSISCKNNSHKGCGGKVVKKEESKVLAIGDVHIVNNDNKNINNLKNTLTYAVENKYDAIIFNGDLVSYAAKENYATLEYIFDSVFGSLSKEERPELLFNMGNHEFYANSKCRHEDTNYDRETKAFRDFANKWMSEPITDNVYKRCIKGINYIIACPGPERKDGSYYLAGLGEYSDSDLNKIKKYLDEATKAEEPVVFAIHNPLGYTYGGKFYRVLGEPNYTKFRNLLINYPSLIYLSSHSHFTNLHERALDQTNFTTITIGPHSNGKYVSDCEFDEFRDLISYSNVSNFDLINDELSSQEFGKTVFGLKLEFGLDKLTIKRVNLSKGIDYIHGSWEIPFGITKDNMHDKFYYEKGERAGEDLKFSDNELLNVTLVNNESSNSLNITFNDVEKYYAVEGYKIEIEDSAGNVVKKIWWQSMFWADLDKKSTYNITLDDIDTTKLSKVNVYPLDFFGHYHEPLTYSYME